MLYESDNAFVPLEKEIKAIKDYLLLEKTKLKNKLEIDIAIKGETRSKMIVPLLLFPFIENSFSFFANTNLETAWINLEFHVENNELTMKLIHGKTNDLAFVSSNRHALEKATKRLEFFYAGNYELKTTVEPEIMMTNLKIVLHENIEETHPKINPNKETMYAAI